MAMAIRSASTLGCVWLCSYSLCTVQYCQDASLVASAEQKKEKGGRRWRGANCDTRTRNNDGERIFPRAPMARHPIRELSTSGRSDKNKRYWIWLVSRSR